MGWWSGACAAARLPARLFGTRDLSGGEAPRGALNAHRAKASYRPDIDGLRAVAVLAVVAFHAFPKLLPGGFIGVDVFFVISGFLISSIVLGELRGGEWSLARFYSRRIRRIFPALIALLVACFLAGWLFLLPPEFEQLCSHVAAAAAFAPNIMLWSEAGYFNPAGDTKPLLHLWSLGVEEQFYVVWPLVLSLAWRMGRSPLSVMAILAGVSFAMNVHGVVQDPASTFFLPQTRAWELLAGSILACFFSRLLPDRAAAPPGARPACAPVLLQSRRLGSLMSIMGITLLLLGFWSISGKSLFPGAWAAVPVAGAVLIIAAGPRAWINRALLSNRLLVGIGIVSYPLYLWHWPLLSFARIVEGDVVSAGGRCAAVALSGVLACLTYKLIECPVRFGRRNRWTVPMLTMSMAAIGLVGFWGYLGRGLPFRLSSSEMYRGDVGHTDYYEHHAQRYVLCTPVHIAEKALVWGRFVRCMQSRPGPVDVALVGDSHAEHLFLGLAEAIPEKNIAFYIKNAPAFVGNEEFLDIFKEVLGSSSIRDVVIALHWFGRVGQVPPGSSLDGEIEKVVDKLQGAGKRVYVVADDVPLFPYEAAQCKWKRRWASKEISCRITAREADGETAGYAAPLREFRHRRPDVPMLEVRKYLCSGDQCSMTKGDEILYRDAHHLNLAGSEYVGKKLVEDNPGLFRP